MSARDATRNVTDRRRSHLRDPRYPQPTLLRSLFDRRLMGLADRGGASGHVGKAWGEISAAWLLEQIGQEFAIRNGSIATITDVIDIDSIPGLAAFASSHGLQNPDFLVEIETEGRRALTAADAKFSIETGKPRQVSADIVHALLDTDGSPVRDLVERSELIFDGFFITPDFELTQQVLTGRIGILRVAVSPEMVVVIPADPTSIFADDALAEAITFLEGIDIRPSGWQHDLMAALYYGRCAFACLACHIDETKPLLGSSLADVPPMAEVVGEIEQRRVTERSAWSLVTSWDEDAETVRAIRVRVHQAAELSIPNRVLREMVEQSAARSGTAPPSLSRVRRELAIWANREMAAQFGVIYHPVARLNHLIDELKRSSHTLGRQVSDQVDRIVAATA